MRYAPLTYLMRGRSYWKNIDWLETQLGYDLFSSVPSSVQTVIESRDIADIKQWLDQHSANSSPSAPLMANFELSDVSGQVATPIISYTAIGHRQCIPPPAKRQYSHRMHRAN